MYRRRGGQLKNKLNRKKSHSICVVVDERELKANSDRPRRMLLFEVEAN
jgi:hypothetical protein